MIARRGAGERLVVSAAPSLVLVEGVKPDYSGPNVSGVVPALLGVRPAEWMPEPVAGARTTVLLVLDGLGWVAFERFPERLPELRAFAGGPITTVVPSTTPAALTSITTGLPPSRHAITGFRFRHDRGVLNAIRWQLADGTRAPDPATCNVSRCSRDVRCRWSPRRCSAPPGSPARTCGRGEFHGWQTTSVLVEHVRQRGGRRRAVRVRLLPGCRRDRPRATASTRRTSRPSCGPPTSSWAQVLDALPADAALVVTADHGQVQVGPDGWLSLAPAAPDGRDVRGRRPLPLPARAPGAAADLGAAAEQLHGGDAWVFRREQLLDEGWLGPDPVSATYRRVGDVVLAARTGVGFVDPTLPYEAQLIGAHGSITAAEM